jgi:CRP/FNR family transcriptional regulator, cyclic AMP receptor protein
LRDSMVFSIPRQQLIRKMEQDTAFAAHFYRAIALFMADRMRSTVALLGYGDDFPPETPQQLLYDLSPTVAERLPMARERLETLIRRLRGF